MAKGSQNGISNNPNGRPKGKPNKAKGKMIAALNNMLENKASKIEGWIDEVYADEGARAALGCVKDFIEFCHPKLARKEIVGDEDANPVQINVNYPVLKDD